MKKMFATINKLTAFLVRAVAAVVILFFLGSCLPFVFGPTAELAAMRRIEAQLGSELIGLYNSVSDFSCFDENGSDSTAAYYSSETWEPLIYNRALELLGEIAKITGKSVGNTRHMIGFRQSGTDEWFLYIDISDMGSYYARMFYMPFFVQPDGAYKSLDGIEGWYYIAAPKG